MAKTDCFGTVNRLDSTFSLLPVGMLVKSSPYQVKRFCHLGKKTMFRRFFLRKSTTQPLSGVPPVRRLKTYSAQTGYVYQYYYEGQRPFEKAAAGIEFVFTVSADRKTWHTTSVIVADQSLRSWEAAHARELSSTERYAICKMALFQAFDERSTPDLMKSEVHVRDADVSGIIETLGL